MSQKNRFIAATMIWLSMWLFVGWIIELHKTIRIEIYAFLTSQRLDQAETEYDAYIESAKSASNNVLLETLSHQIGIPKVHDYAFLSRCIKGNTLLLYGSDQSEDQIVALYQFAFQNPPWRKRNSPNSDPYEADLSFYGDSKITIALYFLPWNEQSAFNIDWNNYSSTSYKSYYVIAFDYADPAFADCSL